MSSSAKRVALDRNALVGAQEWFAKRRGGGLKPDTESDADPIRVSVCVGRAVTIKANQWGYAPSNFLTCIKSARGKHAPSMNDAVGDVKSFASGVRRWALI